MQEEAYLTKDGHYDSYYEEIFGAKRDRYEHDGGQRIKTAVWLCLMEHYTNRETENLK